MKEEILKRIDALADKLGTTARYLFGLYVHQARIEAIQTIILGLIGIVLCIRAYGFAKKAMIAEDSDTRDERLKEGPYWVVTCILGILGLVFLGIFTCSDLLTPLMNPEYWAFKRILSDIHGQ